VELCLRRRVMGGMVVLRMSARIRLDYDVAGRIVGVAYFQSRVCIARGTRHSEMCVYVVYVRTSSEMHFE